jgi:hypothetical protein
MAGPSNSQHQNGNKSDRNQLHGLRLSWLISVFVFSAIISISLGFYRIFSEPVYYISLMPQSKTYETSASGALGLILIYGLPAGFAGMFLLYLVIRFLK